MTTSLEQSRTHLLHATAGLAHRSAADGLEPFLSRYYRHVATEDLLALNERVDGDEKAAPATAAKEWLEEKGLL